MDKFRITGGDKAGAHREPGWGIVVATPAEARAIAKRFKQRAYFWIADGRILLGASSGGPLRRAGARVPRR